MVLLPVTVAALTLLAAVVVPSPRADPTAPKGGGLGQTASTAGPTTSTAEPGTATDAPGTGAGQPGPGDPPADAEAQLRAMFPALGADCTKVEPAQYGDLHLECSTTHVNTWLIQFATADAASAFLQDHADGWQTALFPWHDDAGSAAGFAAFTDTAMPDVNPDGQPVIAWSYTSPEEAVTVAGESIGQVGFDLTNWWISVRTPVVTAP